MYSICLVGAWLIWHVFYRLRVVGRKNLPRGGYVMVCNHTAALDSVFLVLARFAWPKPVIMAKEELFHITPLLSWFFRQAGAVPVERGKGDAEALQQVVDRVRKGHDLLVFPEGTRSRTGEMGRLKSGAFVVAAAAGVPVVPCRVLYQDGRPRFFHKVRMVIGQPLSLQELGLDGDWERMPPPSALRNAKARCLQEMEALRAQHCAAVQ